MNECIFCLEGSDDDRPILHNVKCRCNFCFHMTCYELYDKKATCPMCRASVGELYNSDNSSVDSAYYQNPLTIIEVHQMQQPQQPQQPQQQLQQQQTISSFYIQRSISICMMVILLILIAFIIHNIIQYNK